MVDSEKANQFEQHEYVQNPEHLSDSELGDFLAAVGNHEAKALTLVLMAREPDSIFNGSDIKNGLRHLQGEHPAWIPNAATINDYFKESLVPIGLVAREVHPNGGTGYMLTEKGASDGLAVAGYMLEYSHQHPEVSLKNIFGMTHSNSDKRSPLRRLEFLGVLATSDLPINVSKLMSNIDGQAWNTVRNQLEQLQTADLITYESTRAADFVPEYTAKVPEIKDYPVINHQPRLCGDVASAVNQILHQRSGVRTGEETLSVREVQEIVEVNDPNYQKLGKKTTRNRINEVLREFQRTGLLEATKDMRTLSSITFTEKQYAAVADALNVVDRIGSRDTGVLTEGRSKALEITSQPSVVTSLLEKAKLNSPEANRIDPEIRRQIVVSAMSEVGIAATVDQIMEHVRPPKGIRFTKRTLHSELLRMRDEKTVEAYPVAGGKKAWLPVEQK